MRTRPRPRPQAFIRARRDIREPPYEQVADFEEYTRLYARDVGRSRRSAGSSSVLPSSMIFDDHDVLDDWNTSRSWRRDMRPRRWWRRADHRRAHVVLDLPAPRQPLAGRACARTTCTAPDPRRRPTASRVLRAFAAGRGSRGRRRPRASLWSYRRDFGRVRLLVIDSRCGRVLTEGHRQMVSDAEFDWIEAQVEDGDYDHLLVGDERAVAPAARPARHRGGRRSG